MKRLLLSLTATLIVAAAIPNSIAAQTDDSQVVRPLSERYEFEVPMDWVVEMAPPSFEDAEFPPSELVLVADSADTMEIASNEDFDPFGGEGDGAFLLTTILPVSILQELEDMDTESLAELMTSDIEGETEIYSIELRGITGTAVDTILNDRFLLIAFLEDSDGNLMLLIGGVPLEDRSILDDALESLTYLTFADDDLFDPDNLTATTPIIEGFASVDVPPGWWAFLEDDNDEQSLYVLVPQLATVMDLNDPLGAVVESGELGIVAARVERDDISDEAYNTDGTLNLEAVLVDEFSDGGADLVVEAWDGNPGLQGVSFSAVITETNTAVQGLLLEGDDGLYVIAGLVAAESWPEVEALIEAILNSAQRIAE